MCSFAGSAAICVPSIPAGALHLSMHYYVVSRLVMLYGPCAESFFCWTSLCATMCTETPAGVLYTADRLRFGAPADQGVHDQCHRARREGTQCTFMHNHQKGSPHAHKGVNAHTPIVAASLQCGILILLRFGAHRTPCSEAPCSSPARVAPFTQPVRSRSHHVPLTPLPRPTLHPRAQRCWPPCAWSCSARC